MERRKVDTNNRRRNLVLINSAIYISDKPLSYSANRSIFGPKEREKQTIQTIYSIRREIPNSHIYLVECGKKHLISDEIIDSVDDYVYVGKNTIVRMACDSQYKGLGEALSLYLGTRGIKADKYRYCFKISGRYMVNRNFNTNNFDGRCCFGAKVEGNSISTRLYGFSHSLMKEWRRMLIKSLPNLLKGRSIEELLFLEFNRYNFCRVKTLGLEGLVGPDGSSIKE